MTIEIKKLKKKNLSNKCTKETPLKYVEVDTEETLYTTALNKRELRVFTKSCSHLQKLTIHCLSTLICF